MSKIFTALQKLEGEISGLDLSAVIGESMEVAPASSAAVELPPVAQSSHEPHPKSELPVSEPVREVRRLPLLIPGGVPILPFDGSHGPASEQYRIVRTKIIQHPNHPRVILISSAGPTDGKSITSINLAGALALKSDSSVLLVDADFRRSSIAKLLGIPPAPGLAEALRGACVVHDAIIQTEQFPKLHVLCAGEIPSNPTELLDSPAWSALLALLRRQFSFIVVDAPPIGAVADYDLLQALCDGTIVVVRPDHTNRKLCLQALEAMPKEKLLGILLNCFDDWFLWKTGNSYYYHYSGKSR